MKPELITTSSLKNSVIALPAIARINLEFLKYFTVSLVALACDFALLLLLASYIHYALAAAFSFFAGSLVHYFLSISFVFSRRQLLSKQLLETLIFVSVGAACLIINVLVVALCIELLGATLVVAKIVAAGHSFLFGYIFRKLVLF